MTSPSSSPASRFGPDHNKATLQTTPRKAGSRRGERSEFDGGLHSQGVLPSRTSIVLSLWANVGHKGEQRELGGVRTTWCMKTLKHALPPDHIGERYFLRKPGSITMSGVFIYIVRSSQTRCGSIRRRINDSFATRPDYPRHT